MVFNWNMGFEFVFFSLCLIIGFFSQCCFVLVQAMQVWHVGLRVSTADLKKPYIFMLFSLHLFCLTEIHGLSIPGMYTETFFSFFLPSSKPPHPSVFTLCFHL